MTVVVAGLVMATFLGIAGFARLGTALVAVARADAVAASVALSAARAATVPGAMSQCAVAAQVAATNESSLVACTVADAYVEVAVAVELPTVMGIDLPRAVAVAAAVVGD